MNAYRKIAATALLAGVLFFPAKALIVGFQQPIQRPALIFTGIAHPDHVDSYNLAHSSVIFVFTENDWRLINLPEQYRNTAWVYAGRAQDRAEVWGIAEWDRGDAGSELEIAHSLDDGRSWRHLYTLEKTTRFAFFHSFEMRRDGRGSLTTHLSEDYVMGPDEREGYYTYTTTNGGRTWSRDYRYSQTPPPASDNSIETLPTRSFCIPCAERLPPDDSP